MQFKIECCEDISEHIKKIEEQYPHICVKQYAPNHIFDADKTVRWNWEEVKRQNSANMAEAERSRKLKSEAYNDLNEAVIKYVQNIPYGFTFPRSVAELIIKEAKEQRDDAWHIWLDDFANFAASIIEMQNKNN